MRAVNLQQNMAREGYNPITGEPLNLLKMPRKPEELPKDAGNVGKFMGRTGNFKRNTMANEDSPERVLGKHVERGKDAYGDCKLLLVII